jgi:hypothetical protein
MAPPLAEAPDWLGGWRPTLNGRGAERTRKEGNEPASIKFVVTRRFRGVEKKYSSLEAELEFELS